jgi:hypothetical protein
MVPMNASTSVETIRGDTTQLIEDGDTTARFMASAARKIVGWQVDGMPACRTLGRKATRRPYRREPHMALVLPDRGRATWRVSREPGADVSRSTGTSPPLLVD